MYQQARVLPSPAVEVTLSTFQTFKKSIMYQQPRVPSPGEEGSQAPESFQKRHHGSTIKSPAICTSSEKCKRQGFDFSNKPSCNNSQDPLFRNRGDSQHHALSTSPMHGQLQHTPQNTHASQYSTSHNKAQTHQHPMGTIMMSPRQWPGVTRTPITRIAEKPKAAQAIKAQQSTADVIMYQQPTKTPKPQAGQNCIEHPAETKNPKAVQYLCKLSDKLHHNNLPTAPIQQPAVCGL